jgi:hypothetical protein
MRLLRPDPPNGAAGKQVGTRNDNNESDEDEHEDDLLAEHPDH